MPEISVVESLKPGDESKREVGRAIGGAVIFGLPMMMTGEMWWLGFYIDPERLVVLILISIPVFVGISRIIGFRESRNLADNSLDVFVAYAFGFAVSGIVLLSLGVLSLDNSAGANLTSVMLQAVPASLGALLGRSEIGSGEHDRTDERNYFDEIMVMVVGALFLALNVAPTEEVVLISYQMSAWHTLSLLIFTLLVMHIFGIVGSYASGTKYEEAPVPFFSFYAYTCVAYLVALMLSLLVLWVFGRLDHSSPGQMLAVTQVLIFPAGIGAAASRLII